MRLNEEIIKEKITISFAVDYLYFVTPKTFNNISFKRNSEIKRKLKRSFSYFKIIIKFMPISFLLL